LPGRLLGRLFRLFPLFGFVILMLLLLHALGQNIFSDSRPPPALRNKPRRT